MKRAHDIPEITVTFLSEGIVISDSRISRLKTSGTSPGVSAVQTNAGTPRRAAPVSNENVETREGSDVSPTARRSRKSASRTTVITGVIPTDKARAGWQEGRNSGAGTTPENGSSHFRNGHLECRFSARAIPSIRLRVRVTCLSLSRYLSMPLSPSQSLTAHAIILGYHLSLNCYGQICG